MKATRDFNPRATEATLRDYRDSFWCSLFERPGVCEQGTRGATVWWILRDVDWFRPCWVNIVPYNSTGLIRIRSDSEPKLPKTAWRYPRPHCGGLSHFELTFHPDELANRPNDIAAVHDLIFGCSCIRDFRFASPLFTQTGEVPGYAFSTRADKHYREHRN